MNSKTRACLITAALAAAPLAANATAVTYNFTGTVVAPSHGETSGATVGTAVTGTGLTKLAPLTQLTYLNLSGTKVTSAAVAPLTAMKNLHHIYLFNTPAQPALAADAMQPIARNAQ